LQEDKEKQEIAEGLSKKFYFALFSLLIFLFAVG